jgi:hypothetical protein
MGYTKANFYEGALDMPQWVTMAKAADETGVSKAKISRLASQGRIKSRKDPKDDRVRLVDLDEIRKLFTLESNDEEEE